MWDLSWTSPGSHVPGSQDRGRGAYIIIITVVLYTLSCAQLIDEAHKAPGIVSPPIIIIVNDSISNTGSTT